MTIDGNSETLTEDVRDVLLTPTLNKQCWGFMIGSVLFALGAAPGFATWAGSIAANASYFAGSWFFTGAALIQLVRSGAMTVPVSYSPGKMFRAEWLAASTQLFGAVLFNVSTGDALIALKPAGEQQLVWNPDAAGSVAFLISGVFIYVAFARDNTRFWQWKSSDFWSAHLNWIGCVAFGASAVGGFVTLQGKTIDPVLDNLGTFIGALGFLFSSLIVLPALTKKPE
ncbi:MAG: hypothetical protein QM658_04185 [Gordonia sp. (in: high G+C Gram-positive bacteria)]